MFRISSNERAKSVKEFVTMKMNRKTNWVAEGPRYCSTLLHRYDYRIIELCKARYVFGDGMTYARQTPIAPEERSSEI